MSGPQTADFTNFLVVSDFHAILALSQDLQLRHLDKGIYHVPNLRCYAAL
jgi:hypothetical protein